MSPLPMLYYVMIKNISLAPMPSPALYIVRKMGREGYLIKCDVVIREVVPIIIIFVLNEWMNEWMNEWIAARPAEAMDIQICVTVPKNKMFKHKPLSPATPLSPFTVTPEGIPDFPSYMTAHTPFKFKLEYCWVHYAATSQQCVSK